MPNLNRHMPPMRTSQFSHVPRNDVPRSTFPTTHRHTTTLNANKLVPIFIDECLPGDVFKGDCAVFARLRTPFFPVMDNMHWRMAYYFVPFRILWDHWENFMGARKPNTSSSTDYVIPKIVSKQGGYDVGSVFDYMGLPTASSGLPVLTYVTHSALYLRAYNKIWNEWYRDQNLQDMVDEETGDGPDLYNDYVLMSPGKQHDYFTGALPFAQKGTAVPLPLGTQAPILGLNVDNTIVGTAGNPAAQYKDTTGASATGWTAYTSVENPNTMKVRMLQTAGGGNQRPQIYADMSAITGATINALRTAFTLQQYQEIAARGGTRYTEVIQAHFGVLPEDYRLQRPEYIGGGKGRMKTEAIASTADSEDAPLGDLGAAAVAGGHVSFSYAAAEHGCIIGLLNFTADKTYSQGLHRRWTRNTYLDFAFPVFSHIGEQPIRNDEIYVQGNFTGTQDEGVFGYVPRYDEYRHYPSMITGKFRPNVVGSLDQWHLSIDFGALPVLNGSFIEDASPYARILRAGALADNEQLLVDTTHHIKRTRPLPLTGTPGLRRM